MKRCTVHCFLFVYLLTDSSDVVLGDWPWHRGASRPWPRGIGLASRLLNVMNTHSSKRELNSTKKHVADDNFTWTALSHQDLCLKMLANMAWDIFVAPRSIAKPACMHTVHWILVEGNTPPCMAPASQKQLYYELRAKCVQLFVGRHELHLQVAHWSHVNQPWGKSSKICLPRLWR
jgi:hypothetical protein